MSRLELTPRGDGWELPLAGQQVTRVWLDNESVGLLFRNAAQISIAEPFAVTSPEGRPAVLDPAGPPVALAPALAVLRQVLREGIAFRDGRLELVFADETRFSVPPGPDFEAWTLAGPGGVDGLKIVSMPGGELAIWDDRRPAP